MFMNYVIALGIFQAMLAIALLGLNKSRKPADYILLWLTGCIALHLAIKFVIFTSVDFDEVRRQLNTFIGLAYGPLLWIYAKKVRNEKFLPYKFSVIFFPTILAAIGYLAIIFQLLATGKEPVQIIHYYNTATLLLTVCITPAFACLAMRESTQLSGFWRAEKTLIRRIAILLFCITAIAIGSIIMSWLTPGYDGNMQGARILTYIILLAICVLIGRYRVFLHAALQGELKEEADHSADFSVLPPGSVVPAKLPSLRAASHLEPKEPLLKDAETATENISVSAADILRYQEIVSSADELMRVRKLYKDADLTLDKLAVAVQCSRHHLSEALNQWVGKNFYQYINEYRVEDMVKQLDRCRESGIIPNMLILAYECGFNSKSSFNQYFKKITGLTPTMYLQKSRSGSGHDRVTIPSFP